MDMTLLGTRKKYNVSQIEVAKLLNVPVRTYIRYEQDDNYGSNLKRQMMIKEIEDKYIVTEEKGLLSIELIKKELSVLFESKYKGMVEFCYLFGSYAKGYPNEKSDVDLCISTSLKGLDYIGLIEDIKQILQKKIDLIRFDTLRDNLELISEILKDGVKIYG